MINPDAMFGRLGNRLFQMAYIYSQVKKGEIPDIYIQDHKLFDEYKDDIKKWLGDGIGYLPYTAIHLRVGTNPSVPEEPRYNENPFYANLPITGYYIEAIKLFPNTKFLVFSDDMNFARMYFEGDKFAFDESTDSLESFNMMASCENHIIANSSYSWWAAFLCPHLDQKVVYPKLWFKDGVERVTFPDSWIGL